MKAAGLGSSGSEQVALAAPRLSHRSSLPRLLLRLCLLSRKRRHCQVTCDCRCIRYEHSTAAR